MTSDDLLPGERWCRSCQRPESEAPMHLSWPAERAAMVRTLDILLAFVASELMNSDSVSSPPAGTEQQQARTRSKQAQARTQVREVAAA